MLRRSGHHEFADAGIWQARIEPADLGLPAVNASAASAQAENEPDRDSIERALARASGVVAQAAAELGLSRQALYRRMERLGIVRS